MEVARRVSDAFPGGVVFVDLTPLRDPALVLRRIAATLGVDDRDATPLRDRVVAALRGRRVLMVLDNFEHLLPAATDVVAPSSYAALRASLTRISRRPVAAPRGAHSRRRSRQTAPDLHTQASASRGRPAARILRNPDSSVTFRRSECA